LFCCNFHDVARAILCNIAYNILTRNKLAEHFDSFTNVDLLRLFLFGLSDGAIQISVDIFCAVYEFLKSCGRF